MVEKAGIADLRSSAFTDYYSVIFIGFVNTGLAISRPRSQVGLSGGIFIGFLVICGACSTSSVSVSFHKTF